MSKSVCLTFELGSFIFVCWYIIYQDIYIIYPDNIYKPKESNILSGSVLSLRVRSCETVLPHLVQLHTFIKHGGDNSRFIARCTRCLHLKGIKWYILYLIKWVCNCIGWVAYTYGVVNADVRILVIQGCFNETWSYFPVETQRRLQTMGEALRLCTDLVKRETSYTTNTMDYGYAGSNR